MNEISYKNKVDVISQSLPYIQKFHGKTIVIKYGGNAMTDIALQNSVARDIVLLKLIGIKPVIVHGGGPQINDTLQKVGKRGNFIDGIRITDSETMEIVEWILCGQIQQKIVAMINNSGAKAVGVSGKDGCLIKAQKKFITSTNNKPIDIGYVGDILSIDIQIIRTLQDGGFVPVISPIGYGEDGNSYNINADTVAGKIAESLKAEKLIMMTNTDGLLDKNKSLISEIHINSLEELFANGTITGGMMPKIYSSIEAIKKGTNSVHIINGTIKHCLILEMLTDEGIGTMIYS
ncbi:Acetylglutamate kinase [Candidatus Kinetoplastibacterium sorsogonicusi]|uniref:Acetylglutamate kinase n=1 Tax=Candidatus Kinetoplastidibacterium kentomonadis TaxID=1576550 RepID=A0A3S7JAN5_9PROT|nr:acetylglutamate kinase [Candidatus Kinetoplastibacterium sorsogonicusi]AWD32731.1 Acetylglutamate kinase [Candidatus Kinetoplastibacterium sorsogonicusi]